MNIKIFKFKLNITDIQIIIIPNLLGIISVIVQENNLVLYAKVKADNKKEFTNKVEVQIRGTGNIGAVLSKDWRFMGSHVMLNKLVWHVWLRIIERNRKK